jgi:hypothetical protein
VGQFINNAVAPYKSNGSIPFLFQRIMPVSEVILTVLRLVLLSNVAFEVRYVELNLHLDQVPLHHCPFIPNLLAYADPLDGYPRQAGDLYSVASPIHGKGILPMVLLVTTRPVFDGEELLSTYHEVETCGS